MVHAGRWHVRLLLVVSSALLRRSMGCTQESFVFQALPLRRVVCNQCIISPVGPALHGRVRIVCLTCILWHASSLSVRRCIRCLLPLVPFVPILCGCWLDLISPACLDSAGSTLQPVLLLCCWGVGRWECMLAVARACCGTPAAGVGHPASGCLGREGGLGAWGERVGVRFVTDGADV